MTTSTRTIAGGLLLFAGLAQAQRPTAVTGATIIDGRGGPPIADGVLLVEGERITAVGRSGEIVIPAGAVVKRLRGRFIVPGFIDMHAHLAFGPLVRDSTVTGKMRLPYDDAASREMTRTMLAFGVTTARNPGAPTIQGLALREAIRSGTLPGPRLFTAGEILDVTEWPGLTVAVRTEQEVRAEVARQAGLGVDYVKLYASLSPKLLGAGIDEAHRRGVKALGHLFFTSWTDAANLGIDGIVHIVPGSAALLPEARRAEYLKSIRGTQFMLEWFEHVDFASPEFTRMVDALVTHRVTIDPTLVVFDAMARGDDSAVTRAPDLRFAPPVLLENWRSEFSFDRGWTAEDHGRARRAWPKVLAMTKRLADAGVLITAGTDVPNPWVVPGASLHRELELLADAGFTTGEIITIATANGARALGVEADLGSLQVGRRADFVVLTADPLRDIRNTRRIESVVQSGRWIRPESLLPERARPGR